MAISADFNYADLLSFDKVKLVGRERQNFLDSKELILDYHNISSASKEDCVEWLQTATGSGGGGRLSLVDPTFSFKTYEGTWTCVSIAYNEDTHVIRQTFKIDSSIGDLGDVDVEADFAAQSGDLSRISDGMELERAYYWRIANPARILLPSTARTGEIWTKTSNDNGDGTYDVTVSKEVAQNLTADSAVQAGPSATGGYTEDTTVSTNTLLHVFASDYGGDPAIETSVPNALVGEIKRIDNVPLENGMFRSTITTRTAVSQRFPATGFITYGGDYSAVGGTLIIGRNRTEAQLNADTATINPSPWAYVLSVSVRVNDYGFLDYTLSGRI